MEPLLHAVSSSRLSNHTSRQELIETRIVQNHCHDSPNGENEYPVNLYSSPSKQLYDDLARARFNDETRFQAELDDYTREQAAIHRQALEKSLHEHEQVRRSAEVARQRLELQVQEEIQRRAADELQALEEQRKRLIDQQYHEKARELEAARLEEIQRKAVVDRERQLEQHRKAVEAERKREQAQTRQRDEAIAREAKVADDGSREAPRQKREPLNEATQSSATPTHVSSGLQVNGTGKHGAAAIEGPKISAETVANASKGSAVAQPTAIAETAAAPGTTPAQSDREIRHQRYLDLHQRLKTFRRHFEDMKDKWSKEQRNKFRDWTSAIRTGLAQTAKHDQTQNTKAKNKVKDSIIDAVKAIPEPQIDISPFIISYPLPPGSEAKGPAVLVYLLNLFAKGSIKQFCAENSDQERANPIGIQVVQIFAWQDFQLFGTIPLIDILWAKFHVECPILFGIWGPENTDAGKARIGWQSDADRSYHSIESRELRRAGQKFIWAKSQMHYDRIAGIANGFAAVTLRNFMRAKLDNPAPNRMYWEALALVSNSSAEEVTLSHFTVLKALTDGHIPRFISLYGHAALVALRHALVAFPQRVKPDGAQNMPGQWIAVESMPIQVRKELRLTL